MLVAVLTQTQRDRLVEATRLLPTTPEPATGADAALRRKRTTLALVLAAWVVLYASMLGMCRRSTSCCSRR